MSHTETTEAVGQFNQVETFKLAMPELSDVRLLLGKLTDMVETKEPPNCHRGLCETIRTWLFESKGLRRKYSIEIGVAVVRCLVVTWPEYSGSIVYPVPSGDSVLTPEQAYANRKHLDHVWDASTAYGKLRWDLTQHCIDTIKAMISDGVWS